MRNFRLPKFRIKITTTTIHKASFLSLLSCLLCLFLSAPANAQYYLADNKPQTSSLENQNTDYQNIESADVSGVLSTEGTSGSGASDECMNGFISSFLSITGVCVGIPILAIFLLGSALGRGVNSARLSREQVCEVYLNAEPTPMRRYDPERKHLLESATR